MFQNFKQLEKSIGIKAFKDMQIYNVTDLSISVQYGDAIPFIKSYFRRNEMLEFTLSIA